MKQLLGQVPRFWLARVFRSQPPLPANVTVGLTFRCQSRCKTCRVYEREADDLTADEWRRVFESLGRAPYWFTFSGGEPFLRRDITEIVNAATGICRPGVVNIPTNGLLVDRIAPAVDEICAAAPDTDVIINVSLDGVGAQHDEIRGVPGNYDKALRTLEGLKALDRPNLTVGIHTVISQFNAADIADIAPKLLDLAPDSYVTEVAEQRVELGTMDLPITPDAEAYGQAIEAVQAAVGDRGARGVSAIVRGFRKQYYHMAKRYLSSGELTIPCFAGWASAQIAPDGDVWVCCVRADPIGNVRDVDYDFRAVWRGAEADRVRESVRRKECACPLANAAYTNMLCHPPTVARILWSRLTHAD